MRSILDYIKVFKNIETYKGREPRNKFDGGGKVDEAINHYKKYLKMREWSHQRGTKRTKVIPFNIFFEKFSTENFATGGSAGQLVQNTDDGSRPGYQGKKVNIPPNRAGKFTSESIDKVSDAFLKSYADDDIQILFEKSKSNPKGLLSATDSKAGIFGKITANENYLQAIVKNTGLDKETILNLIEDRDAFIALETTTSSQETRFGDRKKFAQKAEKWLLTNGKRYADPKKFEKAFIRTFGKDNIITKTIKANITGARDLGRPTINFSPDFISEIMGGAQGIDKEKVIKANKVYAYNSTQLEQMFKTVIYNQNENVKNRIIKTFKNIMPEPGSKRTPDLRSIFNNNALLKKFGLNKSITGPIARLLANELNEDLLNNVKNFQKPYLGTTDLIRFLKDRVDPKYKSMFEEAARATAHAQKNQWPQAKKALNLSQNIMYDHKIPKALIESGYADEIEYIKLNPTSEKFNATIKRTQFDQPMIKLTNNWKKATTVDAKAKIVGDMNILKDKFSKKYGNYLDDVKITPDKTGKPIFSSTADVVTKKTDLVKSLETSLQHEKFPTMSEKQQHKFLKQAGFNINKCLSSGGRVKLQGGGGVNTCIRGVIEAEQKKAMKGNKVSFEKFGKFGKYARFAGWFLGPADLAVELVFALPHMLQGDREAAKRATTYGLLGWGEKKLDEVKADSPEAYKYAKHVKDNNDWVDAWFSEQDADQNLEVLKNVPEGSQTEKRALYTNQKNTAINTMAQIQEGYVGYVDEEGKFDPMAGAKGKITLQDYLREDVKKKTDAGFQIDIDLPFYQKKNVAGIAPFKGGQPITNLEQYIEQRNEPYWKSGLEHAAYEAGVPDLFDTFMQGADIKDPRDIYSELPLEYASQLGKMEAEETRRLLAEKKAKEEMDEAAERYGPYTRFATGGRAGYMGGGIAAIRRPNAIPPKRQGLRSILINGKKS